MARTMKLLYLCGLFPLLIITFFSADLNGATLMPVDRYQKVQVFHTREDKTGVLSTLRGEVLSVGTREDAYKKEVSKIAQEHTRATVRLYNGEGLKKGDELFVIDGRNLIVGRISVELVFNSATFGDMLIGYGNFKGTRTGFRVVQRAEDEQGKYSYIYVNRGHYFRESGDNGKAIELYKKAIQHDRGNPEAHLALGQLYLKDQMLPFAHREFLEAYKQITRLYDREDKYLVLKGLTEVRFRQVYEYSIESRLRQAYIDEGIKYASEALKIYADSKDVNFYLGIMYLNNPQPDDVKAKEQFLKVIQLDPLRTEAYVALGELYYKHRNRAKSRMYIDKALEVDPFNPRARQMKTLLE